MTKDKDSELVRLEKFVSKLLDNFRELKAENARLAADLQHRNETIANLEEKLADNASERGDISSRVNRLIEQIEDLEHGLEEDIEQRQQVDNSRQGSLFPME